MLVASPAPELAPAELPALHPVELADLLLLELVARGSGTVSLEPHGAHHAIVWEVGAQRHVLAHVPARVAEAAIARLAILCDRPVSPGQSARLRVERRSHQGVLGAEVVELLVAVRAQEDGLGVDLHALAGSARGAGVAVLGLTEVPQAEEARYRIVEELGRGGMGIVYRARHQALDKEVALKVLSPELAQSPEMVAQFVVEARAACRAHHPNVVDVTDFGQLADGRNFLVMELVTWPTLEARLRAGRLSVEDAVAIARGIAAGLQAVHAQGVVHHDLKPANVFVSPDNEVKLGDFGLAVNLGDGEHPLAEATMGTPKYMAPEQVRRRTDEPRSDLYSLGCILFEMLTGASPFAVGGLADVLHRDERAPLPPLPPTVPEGLQALVRQLLAREPERRPESAEAVVRALARLHPARDGWQRWVV